MPARRYVPVLLLLMGLAAFFALDLGRHFDFALLRDNRERLAVWVDSNPLLATAAYIALYVLVVAFSLPVASFLTVVGGFLFGPVTGTLWTVTGATLGAAMVFLAARSAFGAVLRARAGSMLARLETEFHRNAFHYLLFLRLVPVFPFWLVNIAPAFFGMALGPFLLATMIGILPGTFVFIYFGHGLDAALQRADGFSLEAVATPEILIALTLLALLSLAPVLIKWRRARSGEHGRTD